MMKNKILRAIIIIAIQLIVLPLNASCNDLSDGKRNEINQLVKGYFKGYMLPPARTLDRFASEFFYSSFSGKNPYYAKGDFNGDGYSDLALLIKSGIGENAKMQLAVLLNQLDKNFIPLTCVEMEYRTDVFITSENSGTTLKQAEAIDTPRREVHLSNPAIRLVYVGKSAVVYYWDGKKEKFDSVWIAD